MTRIEIPPRDVQPVFLALIAGREPSGYFEIRSKRHSDGMDQEFIALGDVERAQRVLANRGQLSDTYIGVAPRTRREGGLEAIQNVWTVWADCDTPESIRALASFDPLPTIVIRSGYGAHAYWALREPLPPEWAKRCNRRLALRLGADRNATDAARIMRAAGTFNFKHGQRRPVVCTRCELDVFAIADVAGGLPDDPAYRRAPQRVRELRSDAPNTIEGLVRTVREAPVGNRNASLHWSACRVAEQDGDIEAACGALRDAGLAVGLPEHEIERTLQSALRRQTAA